MKGSSKGIGGIKKLALGHGEKVIMALIVAVAGYLLYSATGNESLPDDLQADKLKSLASQVKTNMDAYTWPDAVDKSPGDIKRYEQSARNTLVISAKDYPLSRRGMDSKITTPTILRSDPNLLAAYDFEGHGLTGLFAFIDEAEAARRMREQAREEENLRIDLREEQDRERDDEERGARGRGGRGGGRGREGGFFGEGMRGGGGLLDEEGLRPVMGVGRRGAGVETDGFEDIKQLSVAVVLAKVPLPEQLQAYKNTFENTPNYDASPDYPQYVGYYIQRAEVRSGAELVWQNVSLRSARDDKRFGGVHETSIRLSTSNWSQGLEEEMDPRYGHPVLTFPQPPLVGRNWDNLSRHSEVPLASEMEEEEMMEEEEGPLLDDVSDEDMFSIGEDGANRLGGRFSGRGGEGGGRRGEMGGMMRGMRGGEGGGRRGEMGGMMRGGERGGRGGGGGFGGFSSGEEFDENGELVVKVPFKMLRFFDLTVQPGKRYKYRVKLVLNNPNFGQLKSILSSEVLAQERKKNLVGEWSDPSPTISIPQAGRVRVAETTDSGERAGSEPVAKMIVESFGLDEKRNPQQAYIELEARRGSIMNFKGEVEALVNGGRFIKKIDDFLIDTGVTVLDIDGGERFSREMNAPTQTLFMDSSGRLYLRDELEDELDVALHRAMFSEEETGRGRGGESGRGMEMMRGEGRGGGGGR